MAVIYANSEVELPLDSAQCTNPQCLMVSSAYELDKDDGGEAYNFAPKFCPACGHQTEAVQDDEDADEDGLAEDETIGG